MAVLLKDEEEPEDFGTIVSFKSLEIIEMGKVIVERAFRIISELRGDGVCTAFNEWLVKYLKNIYSGEVLNFLHRKVSICMHLHMSYCYADFKIDIILWRVGHFKWENIGN